MTPITYTHAFQALLELKKLGIATLKKIHAFALRALDSLSTAFKNFAAAFRFKPTLTKTERQRMEAIHQRANLDNRRASILSPTIAQPSEAAETPSSEELARTFDPTVQEFRSIIKEFVKMTIETIHEDHLDSRLSSAQTQSNLVPNVMNRAAKFVINAGDKQNSLFYKWFNKSTAIDPSMQKVFTILTGISTPEQQASASSMALDVNLEQEVLEFLRHKLPSEIECEEPLTPELLITKYAEPITRWLFSQREQPLNASFDPVFHIQDDIADKVFEVAMNFLIERKINHYLEVFNTSLQRNLKDIVLTTLRSNAERITDMLTARLGDLIEEWKFAESFDKVIHESAKDQVNRIVQAQKVQSDHESTINSALTLLQREPKNIKDRNDRTLAERHMGIVNQQGGVESFLEQTFLEEFSKNSDGYYQLVDLIEKQSALRSIGQSIDNEKLKHDQDLYTTVANEISQLLLQTTYANQSNELKEVSPYSRILKQLKLPQEFYDLKDNLQIISADFINPRTLDFLQQIQNPIGEALQVVFEKSVKEVAKRGLTALIKHLFEMITVEENFDDLNADTTFPVVNKKLILTYFNLMIEQNVAKLAPLLHRTCLNRDNEDYRNELKEDILTVCKNGFYYFKGNEFYSLEPTEGDEINYMNLSDEEWHSFANDACLRLENILLQKHGEENLQRITQKEMEKTLQLHFKEPVTQNDPVWGDISMNLILNVGELPLAGAVNYFIRDALSGIITGSLVDIRGSYHFIFNNINAKLREKLLDKQFIRSLLSNEPPKQLRRSKERLQHQLKITSQIAYDLVYKLAEMKGIVVKAATWTVIGNDPSTINNIANKIYQRTFGREILNQYLVSKAAEHILKDLHGAADRIRERELSRVQATIVHVDAA